MKNLKIYFAIFTLILISSCNDSPNLWTNETARIQFINDTLQSKSFIFEDKSVAIGEIYFEVRTVGFTANRDRTFKIRQVEVKELENAVEGEHFAALDSEEMKKHLVVKAGEAIASFPIIIYRNKLGDKSYVAKFEIIDNEDFIQAEKSSLTCKALFSNTYERPKSYNSYIQNYCMGEYSKVKHQFIHKVLLENTPYLPNEEFFTMIFDEGITDYYKKLLKQELAKYNKEIGTPLMSEPVLPDYPNGKEITFPL